MKKDIIGRYKTLEYGFVSPFVAPPFWAWGNILEKMQKKRKQPRLKYVEA